MYLLFSFILSIHSLDSLYISDFVLVNNILFVIVDLTVNCLIAFTSMSIRFYISCLLSSLLY